MRNRLHNVTIQNYELTPTMTKLDIETLGTRHEKRPPTIPHTREVSFIRLNNVVCRQNPDSIFRLEKLIDVLFLASTRHETSWKRTRESNKELEEENNEKEHQK